MGAEKQLRTGDFWHREQSGGCIISYKKRIASPSLMQDTGCLGLVHWDDPEGWYGEGGGRGFRIGDTCTSMADSCWCIAKPIQYRKVKKKKKIIDYKIIKKKTSIANTSKGVLFLPSSDVYVRSFLYLLYTLIKLYYTHTHTKNLS